MSEREDPPRAKMFLRIGENERAIRPSFVYADYLHDYMSQYAIPYRVDLVFGSVIVNENAAAELFRMAECEDVTDNVKDFLSKTDAVRVIGGNFHSMVVFHSGSDSMYWVKPFSSPQILPQNELVLRIDDAMEVLPLPKQYESMDEAVKAYHDYAIPKRQEWLKEQQEYLATQEQAKPP